MQQWNHRVWYKEDNKMVSHLLYQSETAITVICNPHHFSF